jgi:hypothetical protein
LWKHFEILWGCFFRWKKPSNLVEPEGVAAPKGEAGAV